MNAWKKNSFGSKFASWDIGSRVKLELNPLDVQFIGVRRLVDRRDLTDELKQALIDTINKFPEFKSKD